MITLPYRLGQMIRDSINKYRNEHNIPIPEEIKKLSVYRIRDTFLESEFELVRDIELDKEALEYIDLFPNLTSITIDCSDNFSLFDIKQVIDKYPNLEKLTIKGQDNFQFLDISNLRKLQCLELISNRGLHRVSGLDKAENLSQLTFYDNSTYLEEEKLCEIVAKLSKNGTHCNIDVLYMPIMEKLGISNLENLSWCESVGLGVFGEELKYDTQELKQAVDKAKEIVSNYIKDTDTTKEKFAILYQWMCENVRYDYETLKVNGQEMGKFGGTNGTVNGLVYGSCVCEGYSKSMQMLLKLCGIPSFDVSCIAENPQHTQPRPTINGKKILHNGDHSILKVNIDGICYYSDVTWDASMFQSNLDRKYFLLSSKDILVDHKLVGEENVFSALQSVSNEEFQQLMRFAQERIKTVNMELREKAKTPQEKLADVTKELNLLKQQYDIIATQIGELMRINSKTHISDFHSQLDKLNGKRDVIREKIALALSDQKLYQRAIEEQKENQHKAIILQIEKLLDISITPIDSVTYNLELKTSRATLKDNSLLSREQGAISSQLRQLYYDGELDLKTYNCMNLELMKEYDRMRNMLNLSAGDSINANLQKEKASPYDEQTKDTRRR